MLDSEEHGFLLQLLQTPGPSGFEAAAARLWRERAASYGAEVAADVVGNSFATFNPGGAPTILFVGHLDEIGVVAHYIDDDGFIYISPVGGWDPQVLVAQRIRFIGRDGEVVGVIGRAPIHVIKPRDREKAARLSDLWVDVGARSREEAERLVSVGDPGVIDVPVVPLANRRIACRSIDNRVGAYVVLEAARRYAAQPGAACVIALAAAQEEIAYRGGGAIVGAQRHQPEMAIVVDVTFATDHPNIDKKEHGDHRIGGGPVIGRGGPLSPTVSRLLVDAARARAIPFSMQANGCVTGTDADAVAKAARGVATGLVSIPNRYMHSPNEVVSLDDLEQCMELLAETARRVTASTDFTAH
jgi:endoglucanase